MLSCNHTFDWNKIKILDAEPNYNKRLILVLHIKAQFISLIHRKTLNF